MGPFVASERRIVNTSVSSNNTNGNSCQVPILSMNPAVPSNIKARASSKLGNSVSVGGDNNIMNGLAPKDTNV